MAFDVNHVARGLAIYRDLAQLIMSRLSELGIHTISGFPPHIKQLVDLAVLRKEHTQLCGNICEKLMKDLLTQYFEIQGIGRGKLQKLG
jgi:hypothetical protein